MTSRSAQKSAQKKAIQAYRILEMPRGALDMIIAAVAGANGCTVATDNERDFAGLEVVNSMRGAAGYGHPETAPAGC